MQICDHLRNQWFTRNDAMVGGFYFEQKGAEETKLSLHVNYWRNVNRGTSIRTAEIAMRPS